MADRAAGTDSTDHLTYKGRVWRVESAPVVIDSDGPSELVEVWVRRGEDLGESSEG